MGTALHELPQAIRKRLAGAAGCGFDAVDDVVAELVAPAVTTFGGGRVLSQLIKSREDPYVAAVLVDGCGEGGFRLVPEGATVSRVTDIYSDDEIVGSAAAYLAAFPEAGLSEGCWAWTALWNGWGQVMPDDHLRLVIDLIHRVSDDDEEILSMVADGPLRSLIETVELRDTVLASASSDPKVARALSLM